MVPILISGSALEAVDRTAVAGASDEIELLATVSKGTYIRTLGEDIA